MSTLSTINVSFTITSVNKETNQIIVRPYSTSFKNAPETYPTYCYDLSDFDPAQDLNTQIAKFITPIVQQTIQTESTDCSSLLDIANKMLNTPVTVTVSTNVTQNTLNQPPVGGVINTIDSNPNVNFVS